MISAILGLARQRDETALPAIEELLKRTGEKAAFFAEYLAHFKSEAADRVARGYIDDDGWNDYLEIRNESAEAEP